MNRIATAILLLTLCPAAAFASAAGEAPQAVLPADEVRMSVEIPLEGPLRVTGAELLRVNDLLDERTEFDASDFRLGEVVLVARSEADTAGEAELLIMDWRSGEFDIPPAAAGEWYEVRIPTPPVSEEALEGAWLLDLVGDVTVDMLVAVLEPLPDGTAAQVESRTRTVYRVVDGRRAKVTTRWVHSPHYYHVYHYHHGWPYRYFWGPWHYELVYRPHYRYHHHGHRQVRHKLRDSRRHHRKLRRIHPRARVVVRERHTHSAHRRAPRAAPRRESHPNRHLRPSRGERQHVAASARARTTAGRGGANTRQRPATVRRSDVARPLPSRRDYVRAAPSQQSGQPRRTIRATTTQTRAQTPRGVPERATVRPMPRQRDFVRRPAPRPSIAPVERRMPTARELRNRPADSLSRRTAVPSRPPQRATAKPAPRDFDRTAARPATRPRPQRAAPRPVAEAPPRPTTVRSRPQPQAAPPSAEPPARRARAEPRQTDAPRSRRPSRSDRPERHLR